VGKRRLALRDGENSTRPNVRRCEWQVEVVKRGLGQFEHGVSYTKRGLGTNEGLYNSTGLGIRASPLGPLLRGDPQQKAGGDRKKRGPASENNQLAKGDERRMEKKGDAERRGKGTPESRWACRGVMKLEATNDRKQQLRGSSTTTRGQDQMSP